MSLTLVGGQWRPHEPSTAPQPPTRQSFPLRPLQPTRLDDFPHRVKTVLSHRLLLALRLSLISTAAPAWLWLMATQADDLILSSVIFAFRAGLWATAVCGGLLPLFVLRGRRRTVTRLEAPTKLRRYLNLFSAGGWPDALVPYAVSGTILAVLLALGLGVSTPWQLVLPAARLYETWQFNEACFFHLIVLFSLVGFASFEHALEQRNVISFPTHALPIASRFTSSLADRLPPAILRTLGIAATSVVGFGAFSLIRRSMLIFLLRYVPGVATVRANLFAVFKGGGVGTTTWSFIFFELFYLTVVWEFVNSLADVYFSQPMLVSSTSGNPSKALLSGLSSDDLLIQHFAYSELTSIAQHDAARRIAIFRDIRSSPNGFARLSKECLTLLGRSHRLVEGRGVLQPAGGASTPMSQPAAGGAQQPMIERATVHRESSIFRPARKSFLDGLSQSEKANAAAKARAAAAPPPSPNNEVKPGSGSSAPPGGRPQDNSLVPAIFRSKPPQSPQPSASTPAQPPSGSTSPYNPLVALENQLVQRFPKALGAVEAARVAQCMPHPQLNIWACEALSYLTVASINEDEFGVVQQELPKILEALVTLSSALEGLVAELNQAGPGSQQAVVHSIAPVGSAVQTALARIVDVFGPYLQEFRFPPRIASRLQQQIDWGAKRKT